MALTEAKRSTIASPAVWRALFWLAIGAGVVLSLWPEPPEAQKLFDQSDKVAHFVSFAILVWLGRSGGYRSPLMLGLGLALLAAGIEFAQAQTATRTGDLYDWLAGVAGTGCGLLVSEVAGRILAGVPEKDRR